MLPATLRDSCMCLSLDSRALEFRRRMASLRVGENLLRLRRAERYSHSPGCLVLFFADARARPAGALWQVWMLLELRRQLFSRCCVLEFKRGVSLPAGCEGCELRVCRVWAWTAVVAAPRELAAHCARCRTALFCLGVDDSLLGTFLQRDRLSLSCDLDA